jgi:hypothetical protein
MIQNALIMPADTMCECISQALFKLPIKKQSGSKRGPEAQYESNFVPCSDWDSYYKC